MKNAESGECDAGFWGLWGSGGDLKEGVIPDYRP